MNREAAGSVDLERVVGDPGEELRLPRGGAADPAQAALHRVDCQLHALAARVRERDDVVGHDAVDRVVERVREHVAAELAVADDVEAELDLASDGLANGVIFHPMKRGQVFPPLLREQGVMARLVHRLDGRAQRCRAQQAAHDLRAGGRPRHGQGGEPVGAGYIRPLRLTRVP